MSCPALPGELVGEEDKRPPMVVPLVVDSAVSLVSSWSVVRVSVTENKSVYMKVPGDWCVTHFSQAQVLRLVH